MLKLHLLFSVNDKRRTDNIPHIEEIYLRVVM